MQKIKNYLIRSFKKKKMQIKRYEDHFEDEREFFIEKNINIKKRNFFKETN